MNACTIVRYKRDTTGSEPARMGHRTAMHLQWTEQKLHRQHPDWTILILQSSYNTDVDKSAGTHDKDRVLDVCIIDEHGRIVSWAWQQAFFRRLGWAAWWRQPPAFSNHIHMISLGGGCPVGYLVPGQIADYYNHSTGLAGHAHDPTWHPADIDATIFNYERYLEDDMAYNDWPQADKNALVADIVKGLMSTDVEPSPEETTTVRQALVRGSRTLALQRDTRRDLDGIETKIDAILAEVST